MLTQSIEGVFRSFSVYSGFGSSCSCSSPSSSWNTGEARNSNYSSMAKASFMLAFMTTGYVQSYVAHHSSADSHTERAGVSICTTCKSIRHQSVERMLNIIVYCSALDYPRCTINSNRETDSGRICWSLSVFIAWNLLSMVSHFHGGRRPPLSTRRRALRV